MWFFREHNRIARRLAKINPCWDDDTLFQKARQISIAQWQYIIYYELMPEILGKKTQLYERQKERQLQKLNLWSTSVAKNHWYH